jgi:dihydroorotate dehydrogenase (NAD+) catalytic subunit
MSIELAPNFKRSLTLSSPLILASGSLDGTLVGAVVTFPLTQAPRSAGPAPRVVEIPGGFMLRTGGANPGLAHVLREDARAWAASPCPVIVAFATQAEQHWPEMAARLERVPGVAGIELLFNPIMNAAGALRALRAATDLPILAKLDLDNASAVAAGCVAAGANTLVVARAPRGMAVVQGRAWFGRLYSPAILPVALRAVAEIAALDLGVPLVACGGVHTAGDVRSCLAAGAVAVEVDSGAWIDPQIPVEIARELSTSVPLANGSSGEQVGAGI